MARPSDGERSHGTAQVHTVLLVAGSVLIAVLVALALIQWFGRLS